MNVFGAPTLGFFFFFAKYSAEKTKYIDVSQLGHFLTGGNGTGGMRHLCGKSVRRRAPHK